MADLKDHNAEEFRIEMRRQFPRAFEYLIEQLLPTREIHLVAGAAGVGKTTWLLGVLMKWAKGESVLGFKSHPCPWMYVTGDRTKDGNIRTATRMGIHPQELHIADLPMKPEEGLVQYLIKLKQKHPEVELFVIEGFQSFSPNGKPNEYTPTAKFLRQLTEFCQRENVTIIGVCHSAKRKKNDYYESSRDRMMGSGAWSAYSDCFIIVESADPEDSEATTRNITIMPRNDRNHIYKYDWKDGLLAEVDSKIPQFSPMQKFLQFVLVKYGMNSDNMVFTTSDCRKFTGLASNKQWADLLGDLLAENLVEEKKKGLYRILPYDKQELQQRSGMGSPQ